MVNQVSAEATTRFREKLDELLVAVNERLELDAKFECADIGCDRLGLSRHYNREFGRLLAAVYEFNLLERLAEEFRWYISVLTRRGFGPDYFGRMLGAWSVATMSNISLAEARELAAPLDSLRSNLGLLFEGQRPAPALSRDAAGLLELLRQRRRREAAESLFALLKAGQGVEHVVEDVVLPALSHLGYLWETGEISVAGEHAATDICRYALYRLFDSLDPDRPAGLKALVACVPGEEHELGADIVAEYLRLKEWDVFSVGRSSPQEDVIEALRDFGPDVAFFSVTLLENLPAAHALAGEARRALPGLGVVLGGKAAVAATGVLAGPGVAVAEHFAEAASLGIRLSEKR